VRIAIIGSKGIPGHHGVEVVVENVATRLVALGHEVSILGYNSYFKGLETYKGCDLIGFDGSERYSLEMPTHVLKEIKYLSNREDKYDLVHIHSVDPCMFTKSLRKLYPIVATSHGRVYMREEVGVIRKMASRLAERNFMNTGQVITAVSPIDAKYYRRKYGREVNYIPNGLNTPSGISTEPLAKWSLEPDRYILFSAGRIIPSKGLHLVIEAYSKLNVDIPLVVVGGPGYDGSYYQQMRKTASDKVIFTGFISDDSLWSVYANTMVALFPSDYEAQSMTLLELISLNIPVIYSDIPENLAVADNIGIPFYNGDSDSLRDKMLFFFDNYAMEQSKTLTLSHSIRSVHNWDRIVNLYLKCYERARSIH